MNLSLVSSQIFREVTSEQLSVYEGAGYNEVFRLGHEPEEGFSWSSERETLAQFPDEEVESCKGKGKEGMVGEGEDENDEGEEEREDDGDEETVTRKPQRELQEVPRMTVLSFFLKYGPLMTFCRQCRPRFLTLYGTVTRFWTTSPNQSPWEV